MGRSRRPQAAPEPGAARRGALDRWLGRTGRRLASVDPNARDLGGPEPDLPIAHAGAGGGVLPMIPEADLEPAVPASNVRELGVPFDLEQGPDRGEVPASGGRRLDDREGEPLPGGKESVDRRAVPDAERDRRVAEHLRVRRERAGTRRPRPRSQALAADRADAAQERDRKLAAVDHLILEHALVKDRRARRHHDVASRPRRRRHFSVAALTDERPLDELERRASDGVIRAIQQADLETHPMIGALVADDAVESEEVLAGGPPYQDHDAKAIPFRIECSVGRDSRRWDRLLILFGRAPSVEIAHVRLVEQPDLEAVGGHAAIDGFELDRHEVVTRSLGG